MIPTYYDIKYENSSKIFEAEEIKGLTPDEIKNAENLYNVLLESIQEKKPIDEGLFGALVGGVSAAAFGPAIMKSICKALGINESSPLYNLLTSRLILTAVATYIGSKA